MAAVRATLGGWQLVDAGLKWVEALAGNSFRAVLAPLIVVGLAAPVIAVLSVLLEGPSGAGKSALAAPAAIESEFPFVKARARAAWACVPATRLLRPPCRSRYR